jgi:hypothetical protein
MQSIFITVSKLPSKVKLNFLGKQAYPKVSYTGGGNNMRLAKDLKEGKHFI